MSELLLKQAFADALCEVVKASTHKYLRKYRANGKWRYVYPNKSGGRGVSRHSDDAKVSRSKILTGSFEAGESFALGKGQGHLQITKVDGDTIHFRRDDSDLEISMHKKDMESFLEQAFDGLFVETGKPPTAIEAKAVSESLVQSLRQLSGKSLEKIGELAQAPAKALAKLSGIDVAKYDKISDPYDKAEALISDTVGSIDKITKGVRTILSPVAYKAMIGVVGGAVAGVGMPGGIATAVSLFATGLAMKVAYVAVKHSIKTMHEFAVHGGQALKDAGRELQKAIADKLDPFLSAIAKLSPRELDVIFNGDPKAFYLRQFRSLSERKAAV